MAGSVKTSISPMLSVRHGAKAIEFYKKAFGAEELFRIGEEGNGVVAQMSVGGAEFWLSDEAPEFLSFSPESLGLSSAEVAPCAWCWWCRIRTRFSRAPWEREPN